LALPVDARLASFWIAPLLSCLRSTPLCQLPLGPRFGLVLMLLAPVPHPHPLTVTCCFFFSSTDAILLSKLCLSVLSGWIKVSHLITLVLEPNIPSPPPAPVLLHSLTLLLQNKLFIFYAKHLTSYVFLCWVTILSTRVLVVLLSSTSSSPMIGV